MNRYLLSTAFVLSAASTSITAGAATIHVELPPTVTAHVELGLIGRGLCLRGTPDFTGSASIDIDQLAKGCAALGHDFRPIQQVKALLIAPGYAVATLDTTDPFVAQWAPKLQQLPSVTVSGYVDVPPAQMPRTLSFDYSVLEAMDFFGYVDGGVPVLTVGTAAVGEDGHFNTVLPDLTADPFISGSRSVDVRLPTDSHRAPIEPLRVPLTELASGARLVLRP